MDPNQKQFCLETTCRTCLKNHKTENLVPIFETKYQVKSLIDGLAFIKLKVMENDGLPQNICSICLNKLHSANEFRASCEISQDILEQYFNPTADNSNKLKIEFEMGDIFATQYDIQCNRLDIDEENTVDDTQQNDEEEIFLCKICNVVYHDEPLLLKHMTEIHSIEDNENIWNEATTDGTENLDNDKNEKTNLNKSTTSKTKNLLFCNFIKCNKSEKSKFQGFESIQDLEAHKMKFHQCLICDKTIANLNQHKRTHNNERSYICDICSASFKTITLLKHHQEIHNPILRYKCDYCERKFRQKNHKHRHELTHTGERPLKCNECNKTFIDYCSLNMHVKVKHQGKHPYKCDQCGKGFLTKRQLERHGDSMHGAEAEERLRRDAESRTHQCVECKKSYKRAEHLRTHFKRIHTQLRPFKCEFCGKGFPFAGELKPHLLVHTGEKPHVCPFCPRRFNLAKCMRDHVLRIHKQILDPNKQKK